MQQTKVIALPPPPTPPHFLSPSPPPLPPSFPKMLFSINQSSQLKTGLQLPPQSALSLSFLAIIYFNGLWLIPGEALDLGNNAAEGSRAQTRVQRGLPVD